MATPNKGYATIVTGSSSGTWGDILNADVFSVVDSNMGGLVSKSLSSSNVTLNSTESQAAILRLTGTVLANIQITTSCVGFFFVENLTAGNFTVTITNGVSGTIIPRGRVTVISDSTNGCRVAGTDSMETGTRMTFNQTTAPTGWTKDTGVNNAAFRLVSGSVSSGGALDFTAAFASRTPAGTIGATALTASQIPSHYHYAFNNDQVNVNSNTITFREYPTYLGTSSDNSFNYCIGGSGKTPAFGKTSSTGDGQGHAHTFTGSALDFSVKYVDLIMAVKN